MSQTPQKRRFLPVTGLRYSYLRLPVEKPPSAPGAGWKIGVFIHAYYETELASLLPYLSNIGAPFRLFVSTDTEAKRQYLDGLLRPLYGDAAIVRVFDNRGRDIAPKFVGFRDEQRACDLVLHLHTKKSTHNSKLAGWRSFMIDSLLGSPEIGASILDLFAQKPELGVVAPRIPAVVQSAVKWGRNYCRTVYLARRMGLRLERSLELDFPSGSMFWARSAALRPILDVDLTFGAFEAERGQIDGTTAHAIERLIFYSAERAGYRALHVGASDDAEPFETPVGVEDLDLAYARRSSDSPRIDDRPRSRLGDVWTILKSGAFRHADYAWLHLSSRYLAPIALPHYLLAGEKKGYRPTPFFDPVHYAARRPQASGGNLFAAFLRAPRGAPACAEFDEDWFVARHAEARDAPSPWAFLNDEGLAKMFDPSPGLSLSFVASAYRGRNKRLARTLMKVFERRRGDGKLSCVLRKPDLKAHQAAFRDRIELRALAEGPAKRPWLVFVQTNGDHPAQLHAPERSYDLMLNYYHEPKSPPPPAEHVFVQNGTKTTAIAKLIEERPGLFDPYDYVLFLDDDIDLSPAQLALFFETMRDNGLDFAQPALREGSYGSFPALFHKKDSAGFRRVNYVEIMMPALSRRALAAVGNCFSQGISGFGVDALIGARVARLFGPTIAVVDRVTARHERPIDLEGGPLYRYLSANGVDPGVEMWTILAENHLEHGLSETDKSGN